MKIHKQDKYVAIEVTPKTPARASVVVRDAESGNVLAVDEFNVASEKARSEFVASFPEPIGKRVASLLQEAAVDVVAGSLAAEAPSAEPSALTVLTLEPWPEPVVGVVLFAELSAIIRRYLVLADDAIVALILWIVHTHAIGAAQFSGILALLSPVPRCGKTTVLQILEALCLRPVQITNLTIAGLFRTIEAFSPTLLLDEADTYLKTNRELIGLLNRGHSRMGAFTVRNEKQGDTFVPTLYSLWAPKAIAAIGTIPSTLMDRSIVLPMRRKGEHESVERIRGDRLEEFTTLARQIARWVQDHATELHEADPEVPAKLHSRAADSWRPLLVIADLVGGPWPGQARQAAEALLDNEADLGITGIQLLSDIRDIFLEKQVPDETPTKKLLAALYKRDESPWLEANHGKPLRAEGLSTLLRPFKIGPKKIRLPGKKDVQFRGYRKADFAVSFAHYLPPLKPNTEYPEHTEHGGTGGPGAPGSDDANADDDTTESDQ